MMSYPKAKYSILANFGWVISASVVGLSLFTGYWVTQTDYGWQLPASVWGGTLWGLYLLQRQKLENAKLFVELFQEFNERYDEMHDDLVEAIEFKEQPEKTEQGADSAGKSEESIETKKGEGEARARETCAVECDDPDSVIESYFNLCAEEHLFYKRGFIDEDVWEAWQNGMRYYFGKDVVADLWEEQNEESYYEFRGPAADWS